jgi:hypothetical protein
MAAVDDRLAAWCRRHLGSAAVDRFFGADHLSEVHGLRLADGRAVVLKVRGRQERLHACEAVHHAVWRAGIPCPEPLAGPKPLADDEPDSWVTAEAWADASEIRRGDDLPEVYAQLLADIVAASPPLDSIPSLEPTVSWLRFDHGDAARTWPPPASDRWDPHRIEAELPPYILETARRARARLLQDDVRALPSVVGHGDLSGLNTRWHGTSPTVHDWDSVVALPEAVVAGSTAADFASDERTRLATVAEGGRFFDAYAAARDRSLSANEREIAYAAGAWLAAHNAAFEYLKDGPYPVSEQLALDADERLERAAA